MNVGIQIFRMGSTYHAPILDLAFKPPVYITPCPYEKLRVISRGLNVRSVLYLPMILLVIRRVNCL